MINIVNKLFGSINSNSLKKYGGFVEKVNNLEGEISKLSDQELKNKTNFFKNEFNETGSISKLLPEIFHSDVLDHYIHAAEWEQKDYDISVNDWQLRRYFERG